MKRLNKVLNFIVSIPMWPLCAIAYVAGFWINVMVQSVTYAWQEGWRGANFDD